MNRGHCRNKINSIMEEQTIHLPPSQPANAVPDILGALKKQGLTPRYDKQDWVDWIHLEKCETVISLAVEHGASRSATIEESSNDPPSVGIKMRNAFRQLGWYGSDTEGEYRL